MGAFKSLLGTMRMPFLLLTPACVAVGVGTAHWRGYAIDWGHAIWILIGALAAHISVNAFNEYFDYKSGLDANTQRTPFSGGSGTLPANPRMARATVIMAWVSLVITALIGLYFVWLKGWLLLPLGLVGLLLLVTYTIWWAYHPILCLVAPGLGFGILMVMGTDFALSGAFSWTAFVASLVPTFLVSDLLLLNQFPDVEADQTVGRKHFPITLGRKASSTLYGVLLLLAYATIAAGVILKLLPVACLIALVSALLAWRVYRGVRQAADNVPSLIPFMGQNVVINLATPALVALGLLIG
jgi:1,4-dihydroxy-2-naphthoate octaprenyltransferase